LKGPVRMYQPKVDGPFEASKAVLSAKAECQLWTQKGDDRRNGSIAP